MKFSLFKWFLPLLVFAAISPFTPIIDRTVALFFYDSTTHSFSHNPLFLFLFNYGEIFSFLIAGFALFIFCMSYFSQKLKKWRKGSLALVLTLAIGAGLITNVIFKGFWGRPRPRQIIECGGTHTYRAFWQPNFKPEDSQKSFPSGHVAMGFYFLSLCWVGRRYQSRLLLNSGIICTIVLGGGLIIARVIQGGHFVSDVLASVVLMWIVSLAIDHFLFTSAKKEDTPSSPNDNVSLESG